jgi:N-acetyl-anhydromuramyl-L-alanine amidase AmpD
MKRLFFTLLLFALTLVYAQTPANDELARQQQQTEASIIQQYKQVEPYFQEAYRLYPTMPRGVLETVAFTYSHFHHLAPDTSAREPWEIPATYGVMGLTLNGKGFFRNNLQRVSDLSGIPTDKIQQSPRDNILAYAAAFAALQQQFGLQLQSLPDCFPILDELSELPIPSSEESRFPISSQHYAYCLFVNSATYREACHIQLPLVDMMQVFGRELPLLQAPQTFTSDSKIFDNKEIKSKNTAFTENTKDENSDYPGAIWNPAGTCNYSSRNGREISAVTIHYTQGTYAGSISWFQNCTYNGVGAQASAHYVIRSIDGQITQMVREADKAWHVGNCNPYTIGIEHEAYGNIASYFTPAMYQSSALLTRNICDRNNIPPPRMFYRDTLDDGTVLNSGLHSLGGETACTKIRGHQHFPNQSHTDPGPYWNWNLYFKLVNHDTPVTTYHAISGTLTDSGGQEGNYSNDERRIVTIEVEDAEAIELTFTEFELEENYDFMWIYDGASVFSPLIGRFNTHSPDTVRSTGNAITLEFRSDCATTAAGWLATWNAILPQAVTPPLITGTVNDGLGNDVDEIHNKMVSANWNEATDPLSAIVGYEYAVHYTTPYTTRPLFTGFTTQTHFSERLNVNERQRYYVTVRALNEAGLYSLPLCSDGFIYRPYTDSHRTALSSTRQQILSITPNPCQENFVINREKTLSDNLAGGNIRICIFDMTGRKMVNKTLTEYNTTISTQTWPAGIYFMQVWENRELLFVEKIIKQ